MYPRLQLLHKLLSDDGVIFVCIDENEISHLTKEKGILKKFSCDTSDIKDELAKTLINFFETIFTFPEIFLLSRIIGLLSEITMVFDLKLF